MKNVRVIKKEPKPKEQPVYLDFLKAQVEVIDQKRFKSLDEAKRFYDSLDSYKDPSKELYTWENPHETEKRKNTEGVGEF